MTWPRRPRPPALRHGLQAFPIRWLHLLFFWLRAIQFHVGDGNGRGATVRHEPCCSVLLHLELHLPPHGSCCRHQCVHERHRECRSLLACLLFAGLSLASSIGAVPCNLARLRSRKAAGEAGGHHGDDLSRLQSKGCCAACALRRVRGAREEMPLWIGFSPCAHT